MGQLEPVKGNMYSSKHVTHTTNPIKGSCTHHCPYCYMRRYEKNEEVIKPLRLELNELFTHYGSGNTIFVGSSTDMWAKDVPSEWITAVLNHCALFKDNRYLFQSKNPKRFEEFTDALAMKQAQLATTIETNLSYPEMGLAPVVTERAAAMQRLHNRGFDTVVTIEPIMKFELEELVSLVRRCSPVIVHIGVNTHPKVKVPEPIKGEVLDLIDALKEFTDVDIKDNLQHWLKVH